MVMAPEAKRIAEENHNLIFSFLKKYHLDPEEFYDIAAIGLCNAAVKYEAGRSEFSTFAYRCMYSAVKKEKERRKKSRRTEAVSLQQEFGEHMWNLLCVTPLEDDSEERAVMLCRIKEAFRRLETREREVILMLSEGYRQNEIANLFQLQQSAVSMIKQKFKKMLMEE